MPEHSADHGPCSAFIWYHADAQLAEPLSDWVQKVSSELNVRGRLLVRQQNDKTTFMEIYPSVEETTVAHIEHMAAKQSWFAQLLSTRQAEVFAEVNSVAGKIYPQPGP